LPEYRKNYNGIFPCFFRGLLTTLFSSIAKALDQFLPRVPRFNHFVNESRAPQQYMDLQKDPRIPSPFQPGAWQQDRTTSEISFLKMISDAPLAPITAISAVGQA
jgi:hypothetical protein